MPENNAPSERGNMIPLTHIMLNKKREFTVQAKAFLMATLVRISRRYPEPTLDNVLHPNTKVLIRVWDKFFMYEDNSQRVDLFKAIRKVMLCEYEHDGYYRYRMDFFLEELIKAVNDGSWKRRPIGRPIRGKNWGEPVWDEPVWGIRDDTISINREALERVW